MREKIAIVNQRYGLEVNGGSELYTRQIAEKLAYKYDVEVLTSCSIDYVKWKNEYKEGLDIINGVKVRRFKTQHGRNPKTFALINSEMLYNYKVTKDQYDRWIEEMGPYCPDLVEYLVEHQNEYDVIFVITYLYYPAVKCLLQIKNKIIFIPTAHQEPYIYFKIYEEVFKSPKAYIFLTDEEKNLVFDVFNIKDKYYEVMGVGVDIPAKVNEDAFKNKYFLNEYIVYVGRIDEAKGCKKMFQYFIEYKRRNLNKLKLVLMGKNVIEIPKHEDIINLGFASDEDKFNGIKGSISLVLPSPYESLSISVLEAMSLSKPVLVNGNCDVLKGHCIKSNAGLYYKNYLEFEGCLNYILTHDNEYKVMCNNAKDYVDKYYNWEVIMPKFDNIIKFCS